MMILLPRFLEFLLRHGGRLFIAGAALWIVMGGMAMVGGDSGSYLSSLSGGRTSSSQQAARTSAKSEDYKPVPYALLCMPTDHVMQFQSGDAKAVEYEVAIQRQVQRLVHSLNNPKSPFRLQNPGKGFVILVHKREDKFDLETANFGLMSVTTTIPYDHRERDWEQRCPPASVKSAAHPKHRPEFASSSYQAEWKAVPTLGRQ